jgi:hypothetical protein
MSADPTPQTPSREPETCCELINPADWEDKTIHWEDKLFACAHVRAFFHLPLNFSRVMTELMAEVDAAEAHTGEYLMLSDESSAWGSELMVPVTKAVPGARCLCLSGTFITKAFEGPYKNAHKWYVEMLKHVRDRGQEPGKVYFFYTACPKCAKQFGKNYVVLFAQVK